MQLVAIKHPSAGDNTRSTRCNLSVTVLGVATAWPACPRMPMPCHEGEIQSWQCEFFKPRKASLDWTALILDVCEETTIGDIQSNSFIMSYCATTNKIINIQGKQLTPTINTNKLETGPKQIARVIYRQVAKTANYSKYYIIWNNKEKVLWANNTGNG